MSRLLLLIAAIPVLAFVMLLGCGLILAAGRPRPTPADVQAIQDAPAIGVAPVIDPLEELWALPAYVADPVDRQAADNIHTFDLNPEETS